MKLGQFKIKKSEITNELFSNLLAIEASLYEKNGRGITSSIKDIQLFSTDENDIILSSKDIESMTIFCREIEMLDAERYEHLLAANKGITDLDRYFEAYKRVIEQQDLAAVLQKIAFGSACFQEFDFDQKENDRAIAYTEMYGELPNYEVAEIIERNDLIQKIAQQFNEFFGEKPIIQYLLSPTFSDTSNSDYEFHFLVSGNHILVVFTLCDV